MHDGQKVDATPDTTALEPQPVHLEQQHFELQQQCARLFKQKEDAEAELQALLRTLDATRPQRPDLANLPRSHSYETLLRAADEARAALLVEADARAEAEAALASAQARRAALEAAAKASTAQLEHANAALATEREARERAEAALASLEGTWKQAEAERPAQTAQQEQQDAMATIDQLKEREQSLLAEISQERRNTRAQAGRLTRLCAALHAAGITTTEQPEASEPLQDI